MLDGVRHPRLAHRRLHGPEPSSRRPDLTEIGRPLFTESVFDGTGFGLGFSVVVDPVKNKNLCSKGEMAWGGAASTAFWVDRKEGITAQLHDPAAAVEHMARPGGAPQARLRRAGRLTDCG